MTSRIFGTDGIRGPANRGLLAPPAVARLGLALARVLRETGVEPPRVLIGSDTRESGPTVSAALTSGLRAGGVDVVDGGVLPTPAVALLTRRRFEAGVVVSASHNPWQDNGLKILGGHGRKLDDGAERAVERAYRRRDLDEWAPPGEAGGYRRDHGAAGRYADALLREFRGLRLRGMPVVVDAANGAQSAIAAPLLRRLGARVVSLADRPDGRNVNERCGAMHTTTLRRTVKQEGAALGVAFDGDADRVQFCDGRGRIMDGDHVLAALAPRRLAARKLPHRTVVGTLMTNGALGEHLAHDGIRLLRTPVGDRHIVAAMRSHGYGLGGEPSGHLLVPRRGLLTGDGLFAALEVLRLMVTEDLAAADLPGGYRPWPLEIVSVVIRDRPPIEDLPATSAAISAAETALEGSGRVVVRYSGTEPKLRVMVEARRRRDLRREVDSIVGAVRREVGA